MNKSFSSEQQTYKEKSVSGGVGVEKSKKIGKDGKTKGTVGANAEGTAGAKVTNKGAEVFAEGSAGAKAGIERKTKNGGKLSADVSASADGKAFAGVGKDGLKA